MPEHLLSSVVGELCTPPASAVSLGYRMPAEWDPIDCVYLTRPHNADTWPGVLDKAGAQFDTLVKTLRHHVDVKTTQELGITTNDSWVRDYGPIFVKNDSGELACHDFVFNCWGNKYQPFADDDVVPQFIAAGLELPIWIHHFALEGGSIDVNGEGALLTTDSCLMNPNRNPDLSREQIEAMLGQTLGASHIIWLPGGIAGDDTDGHIDDVARFINGHTVAAVRATDDHPDNAVLERNWEVLKHARDQRGHRLEAIELPMPEPILYDFPPDPSCGDTPGSSGGVRPVPASYANFLFANDALVVPVFGQATDDIALRRLDDALPEHKIVPVRCESLIIGLGAIHCLSMQRPM